MNSFRIKGKKNKNTKKIRKNLLFVQMNYFKRKSIKSIKIHSLHLHHQKFIYKIHIMFDNLKNEKLR